jgi:hypothetical protein
MEGTNIPGHASRPNALSDGSMRKEAGRWREALEALVPQAHQQDVEEDVALGSRASVARHGPPSGRAVTPGWPPSR